MDIFTYGTLMCTEIMTAVAGNCGKGERAVLEGYRRFRVKDEDYPGVRVWAGGAVEGMVYGGLSREAVEKLDRYEGEMYRRDNVEVVMDDGSRREVHVYVVTEEYDSWLSPDDWDFDDFMVNRRERFMGRHRFLSPG